jgi:beta-N-acetylhexosaminidase
LLPSGVVVTPWQPGQLLFVGFEGISFPGELGDLVASGRVGGVILFTRNLRDPHQTRRLVREIRERSPEEAPVVVAIDQEGGRVQRLRDPWTEWPPMRRLGEVGSTELTREVAAALAIELTELGIGLDFAPVVDVDTNPDNPVINDRSFGRTAKVVGEHAVAFIESMQSLQIAACAKHFPGHGDTSLDSHFALPSLPHTLERMREVELPPFVAAARAGVASIMTAHVVFPALDRKRPATLSPEVMAILREEIGYDGLVFTDDLEMKAVADRFRPAELVSGALAAGVDALLVCKQIDLVREMLRLLERSPDEKVERPLTRMLAFKQRFPAPPLPERDTPRPPYPDHLALAERVKKGL